MARKHKPWSRLLAARKRKRKYRVPHGCDQQGRYPTAGEVQCWMQINSGLMDDIEAEYRMLLACRWMPWVAALVAVASVAVSIWTA